MPGRSGEKRKKGSDRSSSNSVKIGYSREPDLISCPECGEKKMVVEIYGSGFCKNSAF
ncbi:MAG: hypothetical protein ACOCTN_07380 [Candidatus Natronoplasma sp.]